MSHGIDTAFVCCFSDDLRQTSDGTRMVNRLVNVVGSCVVVRGHKLLSILTGPVPSYLLVIESIVLWRHTSSLVFALALVSSFDRNAFLLCHLRS